MSPELVSLVVHHRDEGQVLGMFGFGNLAGAAAGAGQHSDGGQSADAVPHQGGAVLLEGDQEGVLGLEAAGGDG